MKKKLEAELISIAHRILKLKDKSDLLLLHHETQKLYETLSVLRFLEMNFDEVKPTINRFDVENKLMQTKMGEVPEPKSEMALEMPEESVPEVKDAFTPIAVFMPQDETEDRGAEDEEMPAEMVPQSISDLDMAVFMPKEETDGRTAQDEELPPVVAEDSLPGIEQSDEFVQEEDESQAGMMQYEEFEDYETESDEVPQFVQDQEIEIAPVPEIETPHIIEIGEEEEEEEPETEPEEEELSESVSGPFEIAEPAVERPSWMNEDIDAEEGKKAPIEISFADLLGHNYSEPIFERVEDLKSSTVETPVFEKDSTDITSENVLPTVSEVPNIEPPVETTDYSAILNAEEEKEEPKPVDHLKPITFALNDKIGFEKHLFGGSGEEMHRVISQLHTFKSFAEAQDFISDMVKPDYNNWEGKEDYEQRFMEIVERRFL